MIEPHARPVHPPTSSLPGSGTGHRVFRCDVMDPEPTVRPPQGRACSSSGRGGGWVGSGVRVGRRTDRWPYSSDRVTERMELDRDRRLGGCCDYSKGDCALCCRPPRRCRADLPVLRSRPTGDPHAQAAPVVRDGSRVRHVLPTLRQGHRIERSVVSVPRLTDGATCREPSTASARRPTRRCHSDWIVSAATGISRVSKRRCRGRPATERTVRNPQDRRCRRQSSGSGCRQAGPPCSRTRRCHTPRGSRSR